ncbi:hypothetical protein KEM48_009301 [Puccinia striiformis f. sp. tritici PST-130]|nr:hypothetical protein KEM48_009301 [Puccinia striiformis f. sp. tritici PST-130]
MTAGSEELIVEAKGEVVLKGVTSKPLLSKTLYISLSLRNNLIAAGALKQKGAIKVPHPTDPSKFIIAFNGETFFEDDTVSRPEPTSKLTSNNSDDEIASDISVTDLAPANSPTTTIKVIPPKPPVDHPDNPNTSGDLPESVNSLGKLI